MVSHSNRNRRRPATGAASQTWNTPTGATMSIMNRNRTGALRTSRGLGPTWRAHRRSETSRYSPLTWGFSGGPGRTRTCDLRIMSPLL